MPSSLVWYGMRAGRMAAMPDGMRIYERRVAAVQRQLAVSHDQLEMALKKLSAMQVGLAAMHACMRACMHACTAIPPCMGLFFLPVHVAMWRALRCSSAVQTHVY